MVQTPLTTLERCCKVRRQFSGTGKKPVLICIIRIATPTLRYGDSVHPGLEAVK